MNHKQLLLNINTVELDKEKSEILRDIGIEQAVENADKKESCWSDEALEYVIKYPHNRFMAEEVRIWAYSEGLNIPPHGRAWGAVIRRAEKAGIIKHDGFKNVSNPKAHRTPASVWIKGE